MILALSTLALAATIEIDAPFTIEVDGRYIRHTDVASVAGLDAGTHRVTLRRLMGPVFCEKRVTVGARDVVRMAWIDGDLVVVGTGQQAALPIEIRRGPGGLTVAGSLFGGGTAAPTAAPVVQDVKPAAGGAMRPGPYLALQSKLRVAESDDQRIDVLRRSASQESSAFTRTQIDELVAMVGDDRRDDARRILSSRAID